MVIIQKKHFLLYNKKDQKLIIKENVQTNIGIQQFKRLFENNSKDYLAMHYQGCCFYFELQQDQAIVCFNEVIKINPNFVESQFYKSETLFRKLQFQEVLDCYIYASKIEEFNNQQINFQIGNLDFFLFKFEKAIKAYKDTKSIDLALIMKAIIYWYKQKTQEALVEAERKRDKYKELFFMLGRLHNELSNKEFTQYYSDQFKKMNEENTYNFQKGNYQNERNFQSFEQLPDREYEIVKFAAWFLDLHAKIICQQKVQWKCPKFFYQSITIVQNGNLNEEQLKQISRYPII